MSNSPIAAGQHAELLTIDTACHGVGGATGAIDRLAGGSVLSNIFHMNRLSIHGDRLVPAVSVFDYFHARPIDRQYLETHLRERFPLLNMFNAASARWSVCSLGSSLLEGQGP